MERPPAHYKTTRAPHPPNLALHRQHLSDLVSQGPRIPHLLMGLPEVPWSHGDTRRLYRYPPIKRDPKKKKKVKATAPELSD